ncbi:antibiotic biosynthesis monooxygenase [Iamia sp. SCSIO 61187]|uniref:putative quinol monooxygenase n=1 Tax=Iamia sp. SCSIO 61187 TaxID=2722752 RepID=UPI001C62B4FC|nr:antibiotic biosynthesis monooxygenase [Iamia sp. SCSIO 61187]QYG92971.1 antibiotic biosynthesis monooxygenase [Iamia sp. SCSIO 61187]
MSAPTDLPYAFVAKIVAKSDQGDALAELLRGALTLANDEPGTIVWFAVRTDESTFWIFDAFPTQDDRNAHATGAIVDALTENADRLLAQAPEILPADVLASKLP